MRLVTIRTLLKTLKKIVPASLNEIVSPCLEIYSKIRYWTQNESRFGLKTITRRRITLKKVKPLVKVQWLFKAFYLYGAVEPLTGECIIQDYDRVNTRLLNLYQFLWIFFMQLCCTDQAGFGA